MTAATREDASHISQFVAPLSSVVFVGGGPRASQWLGNHLRVLRVTDVALVTRIVGGEEQQRRGGERHKVPIREAGFPRLPATNKRRGLHVSWQDEA